MKRIFFRGTDRLDSALGNPLPNSSARPSWFRFRRLALPLGALAVLLGVIYGARAEQMLLMNFKGTLTTTTSDPKLPHKPINSDGLVSHCLQTIGLTNSSPFTLVYHQDSSDLGDTIEDVTGSLTAGTIRDREFVGLLGFEIQFQTTWDAEAGAAIPDEPPSLVITVSAELAFRKHRCENIP